MEKGFIISLIFAGIVGIFALSNSEKVAIDLIFTKLEMSQAIVIFVSAFLGAIIVAMLGWVKDLKYKKTIKDTKKELEALKKEKEILQAELVNKEKDILITELEHKDVQIQQLYDENTGELIINKEIDEND